MGHAMFWARGLGLVLAVAVIGATTPATAIMFPNVPTVTRDTPTTPPATRAPAAVLDVPADEEARPSRFDWQRLKLNALAANVDYRYSSQTVRSVVLDDAGQNTGEVYAETELNTETVRLEYVPLTMLSLFAVVARHDGTSETAISRLSLDGWGFGAGLSAAIATENAFRSDGIAIEVTPLALYDFTYTYNDFQDVGSGVDVYNTTGRVGGFVQHRERARDWGASVFGGANFQAQNKIQRVDSPFGGEITVANHPDDAWAPVIGLSVNHIREGRPDLSLSFEAAISDRESYTLSVRYEFCR